MAESKRFPFVVLSFVLYVVSSQAMPQDDTDTQQTDGDDCVDDADRCLNNISFLQLGMHAGAENHVFDVPNQSLSLTESLGFIDEPDDAWMRRKNVHRSQMEKEFGSGDDPFEEMFGFAKSVDRGKSSSHLPGATWWQIHYEPSFHCEFGQRIGPLGEGGKWVCDPHRITQSVESGKPCLVYSVGSNGQFGFENAVLESISSSCEIHVFDPKPAGIATQNYTATDRDSVPANVTYHQWPLGADGGFLGDVPTKSLATIVHELGHAGRQIDLFKIDCEGCEWLTYNSWNTSGVDIRQIDAELHWSHLLGNSTTQQAAALHDFYGFLFDQGYVVFSKEPNTYGCKGNCIEYGFLKLDRAFGHSSLD